MTMLSLSVSLFEIFPCVQLQQMLILVFLHVTKNRSWRGNNINFWKDACWCKNI